MPRNALYPHTNGTDTLYAQPQAAAWSGTGIVAGSDSAQDSVYLFEDLADDVEYWIRKQSGGSPAEGDVIVGAIGLEVSAGGATAQQVWEYTQRTLTQSQPPSQNTGAAGRFNLTAGYDWVLPFTLGNLGSWEALLFTVKLSPDDTDDQAKIAIRLSNPGDGDDGLQRLNGEAATKGQAAINVVNATTGEITVTVFAVATIEIAPNEGRFYYYDIKRLVGSGSAPATGQQGVITVARAITRATS